MTLVDQCAGWFSSSGWRLRPLECAHGWTPCGVVQKDRAVVRQASPIGDSSWHERSNCSLKSRNRRKRILFEVPRNQFIHAQWRRDKTTKEWGRSVVRTRGGKLTLLEETVLIGDMEKVAQEIWDAAEEFTQL